MNTDNERPTMPRPLKQVLLICAGFLVFGPLLLLNSQALEWLQGVIHWPPAPVIARVPGGFATTPTPLRGAVLALVCVAEAGLIAIAGSRMLAAGIGVGYLVMTLVSRGYLTSWVIQSGRMAGVGEGLIGIMVYAVGVPFIVLATLLVAVLRGAIRGNQGARDEH